MQAANRNVYLKTSLPIPGLLFFGGYVYSRSKSTERKNAQLENLRKAQEDNHRIKNSIDTSLENCKKGERYKPQTSYLSDYPTSNSLTKTSLTLSKT